MPTPFQNVDRVDQSSGVLKGDMCRDARSGQQWPERAAGAIRQFQFPNALIWAVGSMAALTDP
jgi:hypothetical protein